MNYRLQICIFEEIITILHSSKSLTVKREYELNFDVVKYNINVSLRKCMNANSVSVIR